MAEDDNMSIPIAKFRPVDTTVVMSGRVASDIVLFRRESGAEEGREGIIVSSWTHQKCKNAFRNLKEFLRGSQVEKRVCRQIPDSLLE